MAAPTPTRRDRTHNGYSLLETVVALAIVGSAILVAAGSLQSHAALAGRLAARADLVICADDVLEQLRGGAVPLVAGTFDETAAGESGRDCRAVVSVAPADVGGLYSVTVTARASIPGEALSFELTTLVWRP